MAKSVGQTRTKKKDSSKKGSESQATLGIAWYRPEEWSRLLEISADHDELEETYEEVAAQCRNRAS